MVSVIVTVTQAVVATIPVGTFPAETAFSPDGGTAYVTNYGDGTVSVINTAAGKVTATIAVGPGPYGLAVVTALSSQSR